LTNSFNHLVGSHLHDQRHSKTERLGGLEVDHELEFGGLCDRQIARLLAVENPPGIHKFGISTSEVGQKQTSDWRSLKSALPPKADIAGLSSDVRFVP
jgi:hypothetical protein